MNGLRAYWQSTIGKKQVMAVTGVGLAAWVTLHMVGNLQVFQGPDTINHYAALLQGLRGPLWAMRLALLAAAALHVVAATQLTLRNRAARPEAYADRSPQVSTFAARSLRVGGVLLLVYIVIHLLTFTVGNLHPDFIREDVYHNILVVFRSPFKTAFYVLAMAALGLHLYHGVWSSLRSMGTARPSPEPRRRRAALVLALVVALGFAAVPLGVYFGFVK
jgi:succinate dehydrogenase / fumarate reductase cytochrome b subunit